MPKARRSYTSRFANSGTRYVNWELNLEYPKSTTESRFDLETKWFKPDGSPETTQNQVVVLPAGTTNIFTANGWGNADGKYYHAGMYTVEFYIAGKKLGGSKFEIYEGEAPPSGYIQSIDAVIGPILFYESATGRIAKEQRVYQTRFSRSARYLNWEVHLTFPKPASHTAFTIHEIWHRPDGALEKEQDFLAYIEPAWDNSTHSSEGWGSAKGGWIPGTYRVDFYVDKRRVAASSFEIVE